MRREKEEEEEKKKLEVTLYVRRFGCLFFVFLFLFLFPLHLPPTLVTFNTLVNGFWGMENYDDDYFSDDGFESLPPGTLLELEQNAYRATQAQRPPAEPSNPPVLPNPQTVQFIRYDASLNPPAHLHTGLTSEYGGLDVGELDAEVLDHNAGETPALGPPGLATQVAQHQVHPDDGLLQQSFPVAQDSFFPGDMEVEEQHLPQHIYEEFNLRMQKVVRCSRVSW